MALPSISDIARLTADPELRNLNSGVPVAKARLAFNESKWNKADRKWENGATLYVDAELWDDQAERFVDQLHKGDDVFVTGELRTDTWGDDGNRKSKTVLKVRRFKPVPRNTPQQPQEPRGGFSGGFGASSPAGYGTSPQNGTWGGGDEEPPF